MMNSDKEKSAVGAATPATEIDNTSTDIISENEGKVKVVIQHLGEISEIVEIENTIESMNNIVGGMSTAVTTEIGLTLIMNVNGNRRNKPNLKTLWGRIYGTVIMAVKEKDKYVSLTNGQIQIARAWLLKHTYQEENNNGRYD